MLPDAEWQRWLPQLEWVDMPLGPGALRVGQHAQPRVLSDHRHRLAAVCDGERRLGRDRRRRQRGHRRHLAVHGRRSTPSRAVVQSAGQGFRLKAQIDEGRVQPRRPGAAPAAALHPGADHADGADGGVQPPPFAGPAAVPLAAAEPGPAAGQRTRDDAGADRQHARRAPRRRDRRRPQAAEGRADPLRARPHHGARPRGLEQRTCECYAVVKKEYDRLLPERSRDADLACRSVRWQTVGPRRGAQTGCSFHPSERHCLPSRTTSSNCFPRDDRRAPARHLRAGPAGAGRGAVRARRVDEACLLPRRWLHFADRADRRPSGPGSRHGGPRRHAGRATGPGRGHHAAARAGAGRRAPPGASPPPTSGANWRAARPCGAAWTATSTS